MAAVIPTAISASLDTVLRNSGNMLELERRGDEDAAEIYRKQNDINPYMLTVMVCIQQR